MIESTWQGKHGALLIAEIGGNHLGDFTYAKQLTELALGADVDFVKFQLYRGDTLVSPIENPVRNKHFKKFELSDEQHIELAEMCRAADTGYMASVWDAAYLDMIDPYMDIYKVGSGDMTAYPMLKRLVQTEKPILLSTGLSTMDEVGDAVAYLQSVDARYSDPNYLALLQCTAMYPIEPTDSHLAVMQVYQDAFKLPVGYSDHTEGSYALEIAIAMGAQILEFHFTDTRDDQTFRDHKVSLTAAEVRELQQRMQTIYALQGDEDKRPLPSEGDHRITFRRAVYPAYDLAVGTVITEKDLVYLRPNHGIDAREFDDVIGKTVKTPLSAYTAISWDDLA